MNTQNQGVPLPWSGNADGELLTLFPSETSSPASTTSISGFLLDEANSDRPIIGATLQVEGTNITAETDEVGFFQLDHVPASQTFIIIDGSTAFNAPPGQTYPILRQPFENLSDRSHLPPFQISLSPVEVDNETPVNLRNTDTSQFNQLFASTDNIYIDEIPEMIFYNEDPFAYADTATTNIETSVEIEVLANDMDWEGDPISITAIPTNPSNGTVTHNGTTVTYTPNSGFHGIDTFTYQIDDGIENGTGSGVSTADVTVFVTDPTLDTVSFSQSYAYIYEGDPYPENGDLIISRTGTSGDLSVNFEVGTTDADFFYPSATYGVDYTFADGNGNPLSENSITIPDGSNSTTLRVVPIDDTEASEYTESVLINLANGDYNVDVNTRQGEVSIEDNESEVYVYSSDRLALESGFNTGAFQISRYNTSNQDVTVNFRVWGRAIRGVDYVLTDANDNPITGDSITIPAGESSTPIKVHAIADGVLEADESVRLEILEGDGYSLTYPMSDRVRIVDLDSPVSVKIETQDPYAAETTPDPGKFKISRSDNLGDLAVNFQVIESLGSTAATLGVDYILTDVNGNQISGDNITIPDGAFYTYLGIRSINDNLSEGVETVGIALGGDVNYAVSPSGSSAQMDILEKTPISVAVTDPYASEGSDSPFDREGSFLISRLGTSGDLTIDFNIGTSAVNSATFGEDYILTDGNGTSLTGNRITILNGGTAAEILVQPLDDSLGDGYETVQLQFPDTEDYTVVSTTGAYGSDDLIVSIFDNEPVVAVYASDPLSSEVGLDSGEFTIYGTAGISDYTDTFTVDFELVDPATGNPGTLGVDYTLTDGDGNPLTDTEIVMPGGFGSYQAKIRVNPIPDDENDGNEVVRLRLVNDPNLGYSVQDYASTADVLITDDKTITVQTLYNIGEDEAVLDYNGVLLLTRQGTFGDAVINFEIDTNDVDDYTNPATFGEDYILMDGNGVPLNGNSITIPNGGSAAAIIVHPIDDSLGEGYETVRLNFLDGEDFTVASLPFYGYGSYGAESLSSASVIIFDDEPEVGIYTWDHEASEVNGDPGFFQVYRNYGDEGEIAVNFDILTDVGTNAQAAEFGVDYTLTDGNGNPITGNSITIPDGQYSVDIQVNPISDSVDDPNEIVRLRLVNDPTLGYSVSSYSQTADVVISQTPNDGVVIF
jgi:Bacterial Ig domain